MRLGYAWRMSELHAAVGVVHLERLDAVDRRRAGESAASTTKLSPTSLRLTPIPVSDGVRSNYYKYLALLDPGIDRQRLKDRLRADHDVWLSGEVYARPLSAEPVFAIAARRSLPGGR